MARYPRGTRRKPRPMGHTVRCATCDERGTQSRPGASIVLRHRDGCPEAPRPRTEAERAYADLCDEFNDGPSATYSPRLEDFEPRMRNLAHAWAMKMSMPWPPGLGDYDRYFEWRLAEDEKYRQEAASAWEA